LFSYTTVFKPFNNSIILYLIWWVYFGGEFMYYNILVKNDLKQYTYNILIMDSMGNNSGPVGPSSNAAAAVGSVADVKLVDVAITDENIALNVMVSFLNLAHRRGVFSMDESAKIFECVKRFQRQ